MPRKALKPREKRGNPEPDSKFGSIVIARFISKLNFAGKKSTAESIMYDAFDIIKEKTGEDPVAVFNRAIENIRPLLEVRPRRVGGATYQVPMEVPAVRSNTLAINWLIEIARSKSGKPMCERLAQEIIDASKKEGAAMKKREDTHKMAEANKAFAHYRW
ncbi:30S ribosomal protein S7 [Endomicrobium proavitum]|uniref:Small ribosomal subunit protein uS7 n=1 Tax=Endomicrobium proavitum TaxID=1408281 RepID=A0A0G3WK37_9BACT|nr:30S ribosomal protein S7 [Endomicrobium proavitum]AKL98668.1 30S ribosomal protein S7 [Endomicrobium proavitum]